MPPISPIALDPTTIQALADALARKLPTPPICVDQEMAGKMVGVSAKTLERLADEGEEVGRIKVGGRVVFEVASLRRWIESKTQKR